MEPLHDIPTRLCLVAWFYGGFFKTRTVGLGEHMPNTTFEQRRDGFIEACKRGWLKHRGGNDFFLGCQPREQADQQLLATRGGTDDLLLSILRLPHGNIA